MSIGDGDAISTVRAAPAAPARRRSLLVMRGAEIEVRPLPVHGEVTVGRGSGCEIQIEDATLSRRHLRLVLEDRAIRLIDLDSTSGTYIGNALARAGVPIEVSPDDTITAGGVVLAIQEVRRAAPARPQAPSAPPAASCVVAVAGMATAPIVHDPAVRRLYDLAARLARGQIGVLVTGETGAGKDVVAEFIHRQSPRAAGPFVRVNCAALVDSLVEAELFGHERGAFTGAVRERRGLIEAAHGGTLFLDEIGETSPAMQAKLLRVLEDGQVLRVGATAPRPVDVRFVAATNRDLEAELDTGGFRRDLYFRIAGAVLAIPPLRGRPQEIEALARAFVAEAARRIDRAPPALTAAALGALRAHAWPGNVRELRNTIERAVLLCEGEVLEPHAFGLRTAAANAPPAPALAAPAAPARAAPAAGTAPEALLRETLGDLERDRILAALERHGGNQSRAAAELGMPRRTLISRLERYNVPRPRKR